VADATTWSIDYQVREDAESMFIPAELLPQANPGDVVVVTSVQPPVTKRGRVAGPADDEGHGKFLIVAFE
jgi:hypothetical protein